MEKEIKDKSLYWMRKQTSLSRVRDILLLIKKNNGLTHTKIAEIGIREGIFVKKNGNPFAPTPIYHCRRAALKLGLITQEKNRKYIVNPNKFEPCRLMELNRYLAPLNREENFIFQKLLIANSDCRDVFFWLFMGKKNFSWENFVKHGGVVSILPTVIKKQGKKVRTKEYVNKETGDKIILETPVERIAIEWGLQLWGRECALIDEIYINETKHILYPLDLTAALKFDDFLRKFLRLYRPFPNMDWSFFPLDLTIFKLAPVLRTSVEEIQNSFFMTASRELPEYVKFSSSSKGALTFRSLWGEKTENKILKNFIKLNNVWVTHIVVHKKLWEVKHGEIKD